MWGRTIKPRPLQYNYIGDPLPGFSMASLYLGRGREETKAVREWNTSTVASRRRCVCVCALWLQENKQMHGYIESSSSNKTIHSTQYNNQPITTTADNHQPSIINTHTIHNYNTRQQQTSCLYAEKRLEQPPINSTARLHNKTTNSATKIIIIHMHQLCREDRTSHNKPTKTNQINQKRTTTSSPVVSLPKGLIQ